MHKLLVPLDGSARAAAVLPAAIWLARALGSELHLLRVVPSEPPARNREAAAQESVAAQAAARAYLERVAATIHEPNLPVSIATAVGHPTTRILEIVHRDPLITRMVLAPGGAGAGPRPVFGRTADAVLRTAGVPALLVRGGYKLPPLAAGGIILVPLDGSARALPALHEAQTIAAAAGAGLLLVSVLPSGPDLAPLSRAPSWMIEAGQREADRITRELEQIARQIAATGLPVRVHLTQGRPAEEIARLTAASGAALIVMAGYGQSALHWGNVALEVMRRATVPILLPAMFRRQEHKVVEEPRLLIPASVSAWA